MKNKVAAFLTGTVLALTTGILPSEAVNTGAHSVSNPSTNLEIVNLNNSSQTNNNTGTKQVKSENGEVLVAQRRRRRPVKRKCSYKKRVIRRKGRRIIRYVRRCRTVRY